MKKTEAPGKAVGANAQRRAVYAGTFDPLTGSVDLSLTARLDAGKTAEMVRRNRALGALVDNGRLTLPVELGGRDGPEPTRFGDWEKKGIVSDF